MVAVDPGASTRTLSFRHRDPDEGGPTGYQFKQVLVNGEVVWSQDPYHVKYDQYVKQILIDGETLWDRDAGDWWPWFYLQGSELQGVIDITEFVQGKDSVKLEFRFCAKTAVPELDIEYGVDAVLTIGLDLANGGFESDYGWTVESAGPITAAVAVHGPVTGPIRSMGAVSVVMMGTRVTGPVDISGTTGEVDLDHLTIAGPVRLTGNVTYGAPNRLVATTVTGPLTCTGNDPAVTTGARNDTLGPTRGQCQDL